MSTPERLSILTRAENRVKRKRGIESELAQCKKRNKELEAIVARYESLVQEDEDVEGEDYVNDIQPATGASACSSVVSDSVVNGSSVGSDRAASPATIRAPNEIAPSPRFERGSEPKQNFIFDTIRRYFEENVDQDMITSTNLLTRSGHILHTDQNAFTGADLDKYFGQIPVAKGQAVVEPYFKVKTGAPGIWIIVQPPWLRQQFLH